MSFVHLRLHTEYSVVDGTLRIDDAVSAAKDDGQLALGIADLGNLFGAVKHYKACRGKGLKPVVGCDAWIEPMDCAPDAPPGRCCCWCRTSPATTTSRNCWPGPGPATSSATRPCCAGTGCRSWVRA
jgi:DNA polymerase-3 subunit alpha